MSVTPTSLRSALTRLGSPVHGTIMEDGVHVKVKCVCGHDLASVKSPGGWFLTKVYWVVCPKCGLEGDARFDKEDALASFKAKVWLKKRNKAA